MRGLVVHAYNPSTLEAKRQEDLSEFKLSLVYKVSPEKPCLRKTDRQTTDKKKDTSKLTS